MAEDEILTLREVADYLKLTERTLYRLTQEGRLPGFKVGNSWRFRLRDIEAWIEAQKAEVRRDGGRR
jgi:excisionase family DNA binding protein